MYILGPNMYNILLLRHCAWVRVCVTENFLWILIINLNGWKPTHLRRLDKAFHSISGSTIMTFVNGPLQGLKCLNFWSKMCCSFFGIFWIASICKENCSLALATVKSYPFYAVGEYILKSREIVSDLLLQLKRLTQPKRTKEYLK